MPAKRILQAMFVEAAGADATSLSPDLSRQAVTRLSRLVLGVSFAFLLSVPLRWASHGTDLASLRTLSTVVAVAFSLLSFSTFAIFRFGRLADDTVLAVGLVYEVLLCFSIALVEQVFVGFSPMPFRIPLTAVVLLTFALAVPSPPRWRLIATGAAALTQPAAMGLVSIVADGRLQLAEIIGASAPTLVAAAIAAWLSQVVHRLRVDVERALSFGQYELVRQLGEGGMGEVWEARHANLLRPAAVKLIRGETADQYGTAARQRFRREARATASLDSPHTVALFDFGESSDGTLYYAMELLEGVDLETFVQKFGPMRPARALRVALQACRSLAEAHERGLVHRDIKPANLVLCRIAGEVDFLKVLDFGLVKPRFLASDSPVSISGAVSGTPGYVAPEHATGQALDGRADLYSLGCVLYFLLTGQPVFVRRTKMEMLTAHLTLEVTPPSKRLPSARIPEEVDALVLRLLARDREGRPASARALLSVLRKIIETLDDRWTGDEAIAWWHENLSELMKPREQLAL